MALRRRTGDGLSAGIWPGFVDAMTALLLVLMFVLSIFMIMQFVLQETISDKDHSLTELTGRLASLADVLALEKSKTADQLGQITRLTASVADLTSARDAATARAATLEERVAALISERNGALSRAAGAQTARDAAISKQEALQLALAKLRTEVDDAAEQARLAAAKREAMEALIAKLGSAAETRETALGNARDQLSEKEKQRALEAAAAKALRERLANAQTELTALTLSLEEERKRAENTLTLLAAAESAEKHLHQQIGDKAAAAERETALLEVANSELSREKAISAKSSRAITLLNEQTRELRRQLAALGAQLDAAEVKDGKNQTVIANLGKRLNTALAQKVSELARYRSEFFGRMREILGARKNIRIVGDRFVFQSEVLFPVGSAQLDPGGKAELSKFAAVVRDVAAEIPDSLHWILRVDGHTDSQPIRGMGPRGNWLLSQQRALAVVLYLSEHEGIPANRLAATGFGEFQPIDPAHTPEAYARNRRIELRFTER